MAETPKQEAVWALMSAAHDCPSRLNMEAFNEYQERVMEPLREAIRQAS